MAKLKITHTDASGQIHDRYTAPYQINGAYVGGTGGNTTQAGRQIQPTVKVGSNTATVGNILAQKGSHKFRVSDNASPNNVSVCKLVNLATPTAANTMSIQLTLQTIVGANVLAANVAGGATSTFITFTAGNVTGPIPTPPVGSTINGFTGNAANVIVTAIISAGNIQVSTVGNVAAQNTVSISTIAYASKITNRHVWDYSNDGNGATYYNRYRYHLASADTLFVKVNYA
jgi:hypothetical protein